MSSPDPSRTSTSSEPAPRRGRLGSAARRQVARTHASILLFVAIDALLLTGYGATRAVSIHVGWCFALAGWALAAPWIAGFWGRGARIGDLDASSFALSVSSAAVMVATLAFVPEVGALMLMSLMAVVALSAVQLKGTPMLALCIVLPLAAIAGVAATGAVPRVPVASAAEMTLTGVWLAWLMMKCAAHNVTGTELRAMVGRTNAELGAAMQALEKVATTDELTVLPNRRAILSDLQRALRRGPGMRPSVAVAIVDLDRFKQVNDVFGHDIGDRVLRIFAELATRALRRDDRIGRYGGEEFLLVLRDVADVGAAVDAADRLRAAIAAHDWSTVAVGLAVTVSIGVAFVDANDNGNAAIIAADAALYSAKRRGRNRVVVADAAFFDEMREAASLV